MKKKLLSIFAALAVVMGMSACQAGETGQDDFVSETEQSAEEITALEAEKDYSDYEEFPEGWSAERVLNMVSIDGYQLSFPCTIDDILALSEDFEVKNEVSHSENIKMADLLYNDIEVATIFYYNDFNIHYIRINDFFISGYVDIEGIDINNTDEICNLIKSLITTTPDDFELISGNYIDGKIAIRVHYYTSTGTLTIFWEEIK